MSVGTRIDDMPRREQIILCSICVPLVFLTGIKAANYNPLLPHRRMLYYPKTGTYYRPYDYRDASAPVTTGSNTYFYYPRYPFPYEYQNPSASSSGFHAANQLEFIEPIELPNGPKRRPPQRRPRPRPTCTIMGPGGGMA